MDTNDFDKTKRESVAALKKALEANERNAAWASRKLSITPGYMSQLMSGEFLPSLELAIKIGELVEELKKHSLAI